MLLDGLHLFKCIVWCSLCVSCTGRVLILYIDLLLISVTGRQRLPHSIANSEVVQLGKILVHSKNFLMLNRLLVPDL